MPLMVQGASRHSSQARAGSRFIQDGRHATPLIGSRRLDQQLDLTGRADEGPAVRLPHFLIISRDDVLAECCEQTGQLKTGVPACHSSLQFRCRRNNVRRMRRRAVS